MSEPRNIHQAQQADPLEEKAREWWNEWNASFPDLDDANDVERARRYSADAVSALGALLHEVADQARRGDLLAEVGSLRHERELIEADTCRGITDCSTPLFQRVRNIVEALEKAEESRATNAKLLDELYPRLAAERERAEKMTTECQLWMDICRAAEERAEKLERALREAADAARQEEREALREFIDGLTEESATGRAVLAWLDARSSGEERPRELSPAPCDRCGYNGEGYYQPETHPCAIEHHEAVQLKLRSRAEEPKP